MRALAFTGTQAVSGVSRRAADEGHLPGFEPIGSWGMFFAPAKTPTCDR